MENQFIFQNIDERKRLGVQNRLLLPYEKPVIDSLLSGKNNVTVLDIGANDGIKTASLFQDGRVGKVVGLEYNRALAENAESNKSDERFSFYGMDVESPDFREDLRSIMEECGIPSFDIIYLSFVLMHLKNPESLLILLKGFLGSEGRIVITEADDSSSTLIPDEENLLPRFLSILEKDGYSGNRRLGARIEEMVVKAGYGGVRLHVSSVSALEGEEERKKDIFTTFFSYLPEDINLLIKEDGERKEYREWRKWIDSSYLKLKAAVENPSGRISMGVRIISAGKPFFHCEKLTEDEIPEALGIADECVGKNLYKREDFLKAVLDDDYFFTLYKTDEGITAGYIYYYLIDKEELSSSGRLNRPLLDSVYKGDKCARLQSVGVREEYRGEGLGTRMMASSLSKLSFRGVECVYIVCWNPGGRLPLSHALSSCGFKHLIKIDDYWAEDESLICPYCGGRCHCSAEVYYKILKEEGR